MSVDHSKRTSDIRTGLVTPQYHLSVTACPGNMAAKTRRCIRICARSSCGRSRLTCSRFDQWGVLIPCQYNGLPNGTSPGAKHIWSQSQECKCHCAHKRLGWLQKGGRCLFLETPLKDYILYNNIQYLVGVRQRSQAGDCVLLYRPYV